MEPGAQPPSASTTIGTHSTPAARHEGRLVGEFTSDAYLKSMTRSNCGFSYSQPLQGKYDCNIQGCLSATAPIRQKNVGWASTRIGDHPRSFLSRAQGSCLGSIEQKISNVVVAGDPVPVSPTADLMVSHYVCIEAAFRTPINLPKEGDPQPIPQRVSELLVMDVKAKRGRRDNIQPVSSMGKTGRKDQGSGASVRSR